MDWFEKITGFTETNYGDTRNRLPDNQKQAIEKDYLAAKVDDPAAKALRVLLGTDTSGLQVQAVSLDTMRLPKISLAYSLSNASLAA
jgi:hypothetical protein